MTSFNYEIGVRASTGLYDAAKALLDDWEGNLTEAVNRLREAVAAVDAEQAEQESLSAYREAADQLSFVREGECEIDANASVSHGGDEGAYVHAWVWVSDQLAGKEE
jgi:hypothetical protein